MEVTEAVGEDDHYNYTTWTAQTLTESMTDDQFSSERLGNWEKLVILNETEPKSRNIRRLQAPIIWDPEVYENMKIKKCATQPDEPGMMSWRGLVNHIYDEDALIQAYKNSEGKWFYKAEEIGGGIDSIGANVTAKTMYRYIFYNLHPKYWSQVRLGKEQRIYTRIGKFSYLISENSRWFHYLPCKFSANPESVLENRKLLDSLLDKGHTICGPKLDLFDELLNLKGGFEPWFNWSYDLDVIHRAFQQNLRGFFANNESIFRGGVVASEIESAVIIILVNMLSAFLASILVKTDELKCLSDAESSVKQDKEIFDYFQIIKKVSATAVDHGDLQKAIMATSEIAFWISNNYITCKGTLSPFDEENRRTCFSFIKSLKYLERNVYVIGWDRSDWEQQECCAWLV